jgi:hypothetical protein
MGEHMLRDPFTPRLRTLRQLWNETVKEGVPEMFRDLLIKLDEPFNEACKSLAREMGQARGNGDCPEAR